MPSKIMLFCKTLAASAVLALGLSLSPMSAQAAPLASSTGNSVAQALADHSLTEQVHYRRHAHRRYVRPVRVYRPVRMYRPARCVIKHRMVVNRYGELVRRHVRVCYRR